MSNSIHTWVNTALIAGAVLVWILVGGIAQPVPSAGLGGSTSDNWSVGGNLSVTGTSAFTGALSLTSTLGVAGRADFDELATFGGGCLSTTTTSTVSEAQLLANNCVYIAAAGAGQAVVALTLPATSTMTTLIPTAGDCASWWIDASDVAAATTTTITKGAGWDLVGLDATGAGTGADVIDGAEFGKLTACRQIDTDVVGYVEEWIHAD